MANKTIYIKEEDLELFEKFQKVSQESISSVITQALRNQLQAYESKQEEEITLNQVLQLREELLIKALAEKASSIHLEPSKGEDCRVRFRVDGVLHESDPIPAKLYPFLTKHLLSLIEEEDSGLIQRGRISLKIEKQAIEIWLSIFPSVLGPYLVLRVLRKKAFIPELKVLEPDATHSEELKELTQQHHGLLFVTGPTDSGKSTTLYSMLNELNHTEKLIITLENPVEFLLDGCVQIPIQANKGLTFAPLLQSVRQADPDVILVGEIRDKETAIILAEMALTGRLAFSVLHTHSALKAISRLLEIGIPPFMLKDTIIGIVAQQLVRRLCSKCRENDSNSYPRIQQIDAKLKSFSQPKGCSKCRQTGYLGRIPLMEILKPSLAFKKALLEGAQERELEKILNKEEMRTLMEDGLQKASQGHTSIAEVLRVLEKPADWLNSI